jgi:RNA polymerase sigma-B factor
MPRTASLSTERTAQHNAARLFARYRRDHDPATRDALVAHFLPLAYHLARRYHRGADADDLQQVASFGLLKAIDRFDPGRGLAFTSFAVPTILGELKRYFRDHGWTVWVPRDLQELRLRVDAISQTLTGELGRSPTPAELAERANATTEQILEAVAAATAHHPDSLDQPLSDEGDDAIDFLAAEEPGFERVDDAAFVDGLARHALRPRAHHPPTALREGSHAGRDRRPPRDLPDARLPPHPASDHDTPTHHRGKPAATHPHLLATGSPPQRASRTLEPDQGGQFSNRRHGVGSLVGTHVRTCVVSQAEHVFAERARG